MATRYYRALLLKEKASIDVVFPDFPGCVSQGETLQEAAAMAEEALSLHVGGMVEDGDELPEPSELQAPLPDWLAEDVAAEKAQYVETMVRVDLPGKPLRLNVSLPSDLVSKMDSVAAKHGFTRSGFLAQAVRDALKREREAA
jgi:predicted RNase H-like HicB family nuclease